MRLGGPTFESFVDPEGWLSALRRLNYGAAYCPAQAGENEDVAQAYAAAARRADIVIAEVGAWSNPLSPKGEERNAAIAHCQRQLALADAVGARCCVNIAGSRGEKWDGPHPANLTDETFDMIVTVVRKIVDAVRPTRTYYTLETMPWMYPDSPDVYRKLMRAIDRKHFGVHLDPVNLVCSPQRYYGNGKLIKECFEKLGPHIRSCHAKDIVLREALTTHLDETRPGTGGLDYNVFLRELNKLDPDVPLMMEHLATAEDYAQAGSYIRQVAADTRVPIKGPQ